jgi:hypothetical protein
MAAQRKTPKSDKVADAAVDYFAGRSHEEWRRTLLKTNPEQKGQPRMRMRGGVMVDVNQPWSSLHPKAKADNKVAAYDAYAAVQKFPNDREAAATYVHDAWIKRNKGDPNQPKELFKPYAKLSEVEKDKDRAHVDRMKKAIAAVRKPVSKKAPAKAKAKRAGATTVQVDTQSWRRLQNAAKALSAALGRQVTPEALLSAGAEAIVAVSGAVAKARSKKS